MAQRMTLAALAAQVAAMQAVIDERDRRDAEIEQQVRDLLARRVAEPAVPERPLLRVINGVVKRRTARRGKLRLVIRDTQHMIGAICGA